MRMRHPLAAASGRTVDMSSGIHDSLKSLNLPTIWALWAETVTVDVRRNWSDPYPVWKPEPPGPTVEEWDEDCDGEAFCIERPRTAKEMAEATAQYDRELAKWKAEHGDAKIATVRHRTGPDYASVVVEGNGRRVSLLGESERGPWRMMCCSGIGWHEAAEAVREAAQ